MRKPEKPFYFNTSEHLQRIGRQKAGTLSERWQALQTCPDDLIFQHTLRTLPDFAKPIGASGREHVKENFLMTTNVKRWLLLYRLLEGVLTTGVNLSYDRLAARLETMGGATPN